MSVDRCCRNFSNVPNANTMGTSAKFIVTSEIKFVEGVKLKTMETFIFISVPKFYDSKLYCIMSAGHQRRKPPRNQVTDIHILNHTISRLTIFHIYLTKVSGMLVTPAGSLKNMHRNPVKPISEHSST